MKNGILLVILTAIIAFFLTREFFPRHVKETQRIPIIETVYDTVPRLPEWYQDSVSYWKERKYTSDTVNLVIQQTVVDTEFVNVGSDTLARPAVYPLLSYHGGAELGDTATVTTFGLRNGHLGLSKVYIPGILTDIETENAGVTPKFTFVPFPTPERPSFFYKLKMIAIGFGSCAIYNTVK